MTNTPTEQTLPCIWMSAGLLSYRLCDRDYDCEHCPLDLALRGSAPAAPGGESTTAAWVDRFPGDLRYTDGHLWLRGLEAQLPATVRVGLDSFAVAMMGTPRAIELPETDEPVHPGTTLTAFELDGGTVSIGSPVSGRVSCRNEKARGDAALLSSAPYDEGWLLELLVTERPHAELLTADGAREASRIDLQWFRRRIACHLFADATAAGPSLPDGGQILTDLRQILGAARYVGLLKELLR